MKTRMAVANKIVMLLDFIKCINGFKKYPKANNAGKDQ